MKLTIYNDGKQKWQSFEARLADDYGHEMFCGYGRDEAEAVAALKEAVAVTIEDLQGIDWTATPEPVDYRGEPLT